MPKGRPGPDAAAGIPEDAPELELEDSAHGVRTVVRASGDLDFASAPRLAQRLFRLSQNGAADLVVDLSGVTFIDSAGLAALVRGRYFAQAAGGRLVLRDPPRIARRLLTVSGLEGDLLVETSVG